LWLWYQRRINGIDSGHPAAATGRHGPVGSWVMSIMIAGSPSASPVDGHQAGRADAHHPACPDREHPPPAPPEPDLARYVRILITRFATHGPARDPRRCRCGRPSPCAEERQVASLLELTGDACR
jgi:hypothetical protein